MPGKKEPSWPKIKVQPLCCASKNHPGRLCSLRHSVSKRGENFGSELWNWLSVFSHSESKRYWTFVYYWLIEQSRLLIVDPRMFANRLLHCVKVIGCLNSYWFQRIRNLHASFLEANTGNLLRTLLNKCPDLYNICGFNRHVRSWIVWRNWVGWLCVIICNLCNCHCIPVGIYKNL